MSQHTPEPWTAEGPDPFGDYTVSDHSGLAVAAVVNGLVPGRAEQVAANARLIAAAPNLLTVCKQILLKDRHVLGGSLSHSLIRELEVAVAKAEGAPAPGDDHDGNPTVEGQVAS